MGYYGGTGARKVATVSRSADAAADPAGLPDRRRRPGWSTAATGPCRRRWAVPADAVSGIYFAKLVRDDDTGGASHIVFVVRDDDGSSDLLFQTSDTTWQAYNQLRRQQPLRRHARPAAPTRSATTGRSPRAATGARGLASSTPSTRWSAGSRPTATTSATSPASTPTAAAPSCSSTRSSCRSATTSTGRAAARQRRGGARRRRQPGLLQRQRGLLEDALGEQHRRLGHALPHAGLLQGDARQRQDRPAARRLDRHLARPALQPAGRRRPAGERADRHDLHGQRPATDAITVPAADGKMRFWRNTSVATLAAGADGDAADRHARLRVGRGPRQRLPARRA